MVSRSRISGARRKALSADWKACWK